MNSLQAPPLSAEQSAPDGRAGYLVRILLPLVVLAIGVAAWELVVRANDIPPYVLPGPGAVFRTLVNDWPVLSRSLLTTLQTTLEGFVAAAVGGIVLALWRNLRKTVIFVTHSVFESVYLSQRVVVMTSRPGRVGAEFRIEAPEPRGEDFRTSADYAGYCRKVSNALVPLREGQSGS